jgi:hypothetical protein
VSRDSRLNLFTLLPRFQLAECSDGQILDLSYRACKAICTAVHMQHPRSELLTPNRASDHYLPPVQSRIKASELALE